MKVVYFGTDVFLPCFDYLAAEHEILALYTYHNEEDYFTEYEITRRAGKLKIPIHYEAITPQRIAQYAVKEGCGLFFLAEYDRILPLTEHLDCFRGINTHSSLLPQGRGYYPIEAAMERGLARTGVTMHRLTSRLDGGAILAQREVVLTPEMDSIDIYLQCAAHAREMLAQIMEDFDRFWTYSTPQGIDSTYWKRPALELLTLTHRHTPNEALQVFRRYNSMTQVQLGGQWYYVSALMTGSASLPEDALPLAPGRWLYRLSGGHLRLSVHPIPPDHPRSSSGT